MAESAQFTIQETTDRLFCIYFYRRHLDIACRDLIGLDLAPHHSLVLRDWGRGKPINLFFASRGMGKSVLLAIFYLLTSMLYPNLKTVVTAGQGFRGSKMILLEVDRIIRGFLSGQRKHGYSRACLADPNKPLSKDPSHWFIQFTNGSVLYGVPLAASVDGQTLRGLRGHFLGMDEAFLIPTKLYQSVIEPMANVLYDPTKPAEEQPIRNMMLSISTCDYDFRDFYKQYIYYNSVLTSGDRGHNVTGAEEEELTPEDLSVFEFNIDDSYYMYKDKRKFTWGLDFVRMMKKYNSPTTDKALWKAENKNIPLNLQGGYFPFEDIDKGQNIVLEIKNETYPEALDSCSAPCILGVDTAPAGDNTAFVVIKCGTLDTKQDVEKCLTASMGGECPLLGSGKRCNLRSYNQVIFAHEENKMSQRDRITLIYELRRRYNIVAIGMDARGGGLELADLLMDSDYIREFVGPEAKPICDLERFPDAKGDAILTLFSTTQDMNMLYNGYMKGLISNQSLLFPKPLRGRPDNPRVFESAGHLESLTSQVARIKAVPAGKGVRFDIESVDPKTGRPKPGKKDLYSALLYAVGRMRDLIEESMREGDVIKIPTALPISFDM